MTITRFGIDGGISSPTGDFSGKSSIYSKGQITAFGLSGGIRSLLGGDFSGKSESGEYNKDQITKFGLSGGIRNLLGGDYSTKQPIYIPSEPGECPGWFINNGWAIESAAALFTLGWLGCDQAVTPDIIRDVGSHVRFFDPQEDDEELLLMITAFMEMLNG